VPGRAELGAAGHAPSDLEVAKAVMEANERFEAARPAAHVLPGAACEDERDG